MTLFPRTLLWRSVLLIALVLIVAHLAWLQIFRVTEREPRARQVAQQIVSVVNLTRAALITAQPSKRLELLQDLSQQEGIQIYLGRPDERVDYWIRMPREPRAYAQRLYAALRELDAAQCETILIEMPPETGEWPAVWDRLSRATG